MCQNNDKTKTVFSRFSKIIALIKVKKIQAYEDNLRYINILHNHNFPMFELLCDFSFPCLINFINNEVILTERRPGNKFKFNECGMNESLETGDQMTSYSLTLFVVIRTISLEQ